MHIMTSQGWQALHVQVITRSSDPVPYNGVPAPYAGVFPSQALCDCVNSMKQDMKYFDNGLRMQYGKPDRRVETDNMEPIHPIAQMPEGF